MKECTNDFFVLYSNKDVDSMQTAMSEICDRLSISYDLWSYDQFMDSGDDIDGFIENKIEESPFIVAFITSETLNLPDYSRYLKYALDSNKTIIPVTFDGGWVLKFKKRVEFRKKILSYKDEVDKIELFEEIHALLGLSKRGDVYGSRVSITMNMGSSYDVFVDGNKVYADYVEAQPCELILSKGVHKLLFYTNQPYEVWGEYTCKIESNDKQYVYSLSLQSDYQIGSESGSEEIQALLDSDFKSQDFHSFVSFFGWVENDKILLLDSSHKLLKVDMILKYFYKEYYNNLKIEPLWHHHSVQFPNILYTLIAFPILYFLNKSWGSAVLYQILIMVLYILTQSVVNKILNVFDEMQQKVKIKGVKSSNSSNYQYYYSKCQSVLKMLNARDHMDSYPAPVEARVLFNPGNSSYDHQFFSNAYN